MPGAPVFVEFQALGIREVQRAFQTVEQALLKMDRNVTTTATRSARARVSDADKAAKDKVKSEEKATKEKQRLVDKEARDGERTAERLKRAAEKAARDTVAAWKRTDKELERVRDKGARDALRAYDKEQREKDRIAARWVKKREAEQRKEQGERGRFARATGNAVVSQVGGAVRGAVGLAGRVLQLGGGFNIADSVQRNVSAMGRAANIANSGQIFGDAAHPEFAVRRNPKEIAAKARAVGTEYGIDQDTALGGLEKFTSKTGHLTTGMNMMRGLAQMARASGASFEDLADAAGDVFNADQTQSAEQVLSIMRAIAAQGKLGAVEIKDLATQMAKLGAAAGQFEGKADETIVKMGALAQGSRQKGGSASATQAATSVLGFANVFSKGKRLDQFKAFGVNVHGEGGKIRAPEQIIMDAIKSAGDKKHGGMSEFDRNMGKMFQDVTARRTTRAFESVYKEAGGGEAGQKAVQKYFDELAKASMTEAQEKEAAAARMKELDTQYEVAVAKLHDAVATGLVPEFVKLLPLLENAIPHFARMVQFFGEVAGLAAEHPIKAAIAGLGAVISKAVIAEFASAQIAKAVSSSIGASLATKGAISVATATLAITTAMLMVDKMIDEKKKQTDEAIAGGAKLQNMTSELQAKAQAGTVTPEDIATAEKAVGEGDASVRKQKRDIGWKHRSMTEHAVGVIGSIVAPSATKEALDKEYAAQSQTLNRTVADLQELQKALQMSQKALTEHAAATANATGAAGAASPNKENRKTSMAQRGGAAPN